MLLCILLGGCGRCGDAHRQPIATLASIAGPSVVRDYAAHVHAWEAAQPGAQLALGDGARTDPRTTAELVFINGARLSMREATTVRLVADSGDSDTALDVEAGSARLRVGNRGLSLRTHVGLATIAPDSEILLTRDGQGLGFAVALGEVSFRDLDAGVVSLGAGDSMNVGIGMAVLEIKRAQRGLEAPAEEPAEEPARPPHTVQVTRGGVRVSEADGSTRMLGRGTHTLVPGAQLKVVAGSEALVARGNERVRLRGAGDAVLTDDEALLELRRGTAVLQADGPDGVLRVPEGSLRAHCDAAGTRATVAVDPRDAKLTVTQGRVTATLGGNTDLLTAGGERSWSHGEVVVQPGPRHHNLRARAGESFIVHAPEAPVAVGFDIGKCPGEGVLEALGGRQQSRGTRSANLLFYAGIRGYTLRCIGARGVGNIVARGTVQVLVDPGTRKLPTRAPTSKVEADGRTYTIYYQDQLPDVAVRWPNAPAQPQYQIVLDGNATVLAAPAHTFVSGQLRDGTHTLMFQAGSRRSRTTTVIVRFDNAAPKASLGAPSNRDFAPGDLVTVEGVALPGWRVALPGGSVQSGAGDRFSGQVQTSEESPDIAVRLSHPRLGTHYYLRRAAGSP